MAVLPSEVTVTAVVATTNITPGETETANQRQSAGHVTTKAISEAVVLIDRPLSTTG